MAGKAPLGGEPGTTEMETGARPKQRGGRIVPSRYLQYDKKATGKGTSNTNLSLAKGLGNVGSPKRPSVQFQKYKTSVEITPGVLQSTFLDSHESSRPELEVSAINEKSHYKTPVSKLNIKGSSKKKQISISSDSDDLIGMLDSQMLLLTYASIKMEKNLALLEGKAERNLLMLCEEVGKLQRNAHEKKHKLQHLKKETELSEALERQLEILGPVSEQCAQFREEYKHFATALDTTRHELPLKDIYVEENMGQYLADLQKSLAMTQNVLNEALLQNFEENAKALNVMRKLEEVSLKLDAELPRTFAHVVDLSADVSKEASLHYQKVCEDTLGLETVKQLYFS
ncbi:HAUS augmin-like complex subunit 8 isoform X1 [Python bivittatus]|uniref:HAUS augmin-like complex subunit 8 isoform X1 n=2 Tax=Python bivittatus TaxID=176946 RepID=A0A9F2R0M3_PYTBI|nr:HAUS augmin-like complex subunit 8 isoform X1 [Python bivittatus]